MEKYFEEWDGKQFPVREVMFNEYDVVKVAGEELWDEISYAYENLNGRLSNLTMKSSSTASMDSSRATRRTKRLLSI